MRPFIDLVLWGLLIWGLFMDWALTLKIFAVYVALAFLYACAEVFCDRVTNWRQ